MHRYSITYHRRGPEGRELLEAQVDVTSMAQALIEHAEYWAERGYEVEHIMCIQGSEV